MPLAHLSLSHIAILSHVTFPIGTRSSCLGLHLDCPRDCRNDIALPRYLCRQMTCERNLSKLMAEPNLYVGSCLLKADWQNDADKHSLHALHSLLICMSNEAWKGVDE